MTLLSLGEYGYMGMVNNAAFYIHKKLQMKGTTAAVVYKDWEEGVNKNHWLGTVRYFDFTSTILCTFADTEIWNLLDSVVIIKV